MASSECKKCGTSKRYASGRCATCSRRSTKKWLKTHAERIPAKYQRSKARFRRFLEQKKDVPCKDCGGRFPACAMDFDHVHGQKSFGVGLGRTTAKNVVLAEIAKCEVVCANCHRIRTWNRSHDWLEQV